MASTEITSREYKLLLSTTRFRDRDEAAKEWLALVRRVIERADGRRVSQKAVDAVKDGKTFDLAHDDPDAEKIEELLEPKKRETSFLDTAANALRSDGWILRVRRKKGKPSLTLKFRSPDRLLSGLKSVDATQPGEPKFEEDIVPPFTSQYSRSNTLEDLAEEDVPRTVGDATALFPALGALELPAATRLDLVDDLVIQERVLHVGGFRFGEGPILEMSHTFWYVGETEDRYPMVAEFSFEFEAKDGEFDAATVEGCGTVYRALQAQAGWTDVAGTTKSSIVAGGV